MMHRRMLREWVLIFCMLLSACAPLGTPQSAAVASAVLVPSPFPVSLSTPAPNSPLTLLLTTDNGGGQPGEIHQVFDIAYAHMQGVDSHLQSLDVYYSGPVMAPHPVMIYVHGGGWAAGDKAHLDFKPEFFLKAGYVLVSVNYRLSPKAKFPAHVQDVATAIAWVHQNIGQYGGNPDRLYVSGHSAGGHLATLVATDERYLKEQGLTLAVLKGVVSIDTAGYDISVFASRCKNHILPEPYSITFGQTPADWKQASPVSYIESGKHIPPMALIYSGDVGIGSDVRREQMAREFGDKLSEAQVVNEVFGALAKNHDEINAEFGQSGDLVSLKTLEFLKKINAAP